MRPLRLPQKSLEMIQKIHAKLLENLATRMFQCLRTTETKPVLIKKFLMKENVDKGIIGTYDTIVNSSARSVPRRTTRKITAVEVIPKVIYFRVFTRNNPHFKYFYSSNLENQTRASFSFCTCNERKRLNVF